MSSIAWWVASLADPDPVRRAQAAADLAQLGPKAARAATALVWASGDESEEVRKWVVRGLECLGRPHPTDVERLSELLTDLNPDVAYWAATLLGRLGPDAAPAVQALASALVLFPIAVRRRVAWALGEIGSLAASSLPSLRLAATDNDEELAELALRSIARIRADGAPNVINKDERV